MQTGRNQPCPCGSGRKYKQCHGAIGAVAGARPLGDGALSPPIMPAPGETGGSRTVLRRGCDGCTACCGPALQLNDPELQVPKGASCPAVTATGCSRWGRNQPALCRAFHCAYLTHTGSLTPAHRPDRIGAIYFQNATGRATLSECRPGGLLDWLRNEVWAEAVRQGLGAGGELMLSFWDDPCHAEGVLVQRIAGALRCGLALHDADRSPVLEVEPAQGSTKLYRSVFLSLRELSFDPDALIRMLGDRPNLFLNADRADAAGLRPRFMLTRRQVEVLGVLRSATVLSKHPASCVAD